LCFVGPFALTKCPTIKRARFVDCNPHHEDSTVPTGPDAVDALDKSLLQPCRAPQRWSQSIASSVLLDATRVTLVVDSRGCG
jgi:hypothetical protein